MGVQGSGKSAVGKLLKERGYNVIEADIDKHQGTSIAYYIDKASGKGVNMMPRPRPTNWLKEYDWVWRPEVIRRQLAEWPGQTNFVCGDSRNKQEAYHLFDKIFVLSTDDEILRQRLLSRTDNYFGKDPAEFKWIVEQNKILAVEASNAGGIILDAGKPLEQIVRPNHRIN